MHVWICAVFIMALVATVANAGKKKPSWHFPRAHPMLPLSRLNERNNFNMTDCEEKYFLQKLDHFGFSLKNQMFKQRYFDCKPAGTHWQPDGTIFFYTGNEADVTLFVRSTGLMWENALRFNARLIFAEHRYFGKSLPVPGNPMPPSDMLKYLTTDQAMADYSTIINTLRTKWNSAKSPVIAFGGSYGGMLAAWMRIKYPDVITGAIAASAPVVQFLDMDPPYNPDGFNQAVTMDTTFERGGGHYCEQNIRQSWLDMQSIAQTPGGLSQLSSIFMSCNPLNTSYDVDNVADVISNAFGTMAMSSYPYPSSYLLLGGKGVLPAYPMRVGCKFLNKVFMEKQDRLAGLMKFFIVYANATGDFTCLNPTATVNRATEVVDYLWGYLACNTIFMPFGQNGKTDMFWPDPWDKDASIAMCQEEYGITPQPDWVKIQYGGWGVTRWGSNIFFSNGAYDPWRPGGITKSLEYSVTAHTIPKMGHHADLMFSDPHDTVQLRETRGIEIMGIEMWIREHRRAWEGKF